MYDNDHIVWVLPPDVFLPIPVSPTTEIHMSNIQHITIEKDGHLLAEAVVQSHPDLIDAQLRVETRQIPSRNRSAATPEAPESKVAAADCTTRARRDKFLGNHHANNT